MAHHVPDRVLREIVSFARKYHIEKVILFGSRAKGTHTERSDIDIAVLGGDFDGFYWALRDNIHSLLTFDIVEMADDILKTKGLCMANSSCLRDLLRYYEVPIYKNAKLLEIIENGIVIETAEKTIQLECDDVIMSCGYMPDTRLVDGGTQQGKTNIHIVGDVKKVGNLKTAIWEAYDLAFSL